jgi:uncharacterized membrane protein YfcA
MRILFFFCAAFIPSVIGAVSGIGGGIIIKPVLDAFSGLRLQEIIFLSGFTVLSMSFVSLLRNRKNGAALERGRGTAMAVGAALGGVGGKAVFDLFLAVFPGTALTGMVQSVMLTGLTGVVMVYLRRKGSIVPKNIRSPLSCVFLGLGLGLVSAFLGIGGGPINIMVISYFLGMDSKTTVLHSLYTIFLSQTAGFLFSVLSGNIYPQNSFITTSMITGGILGGLLGSHIVKKMRNEETDRFFYFVLLMVMILSAYNIIRFFLLFLSDV